MASYQVFVRLLDGKTRCFQFSRPTVSGLCLKQNIQEVTKMPVGFLRLVSGTREISDQALISASHDAWFPSVNVVLRLRGGKGGFGSLLRGAATKAGQKKTNNFDACRDMSGRRLRHVNAEKKLEEWKAGAEERKLEKIAEEFLKRKAKEAKKSKSGESAKYVQKYREVSAKCMEEVEASVRESFVLYHNSKRKALPGLEMASKKPKIWTGKGKKIESESDEEEVDDEKSTVIGNGNDAADGSPGSSSVEQSDEESGGSSSKSTLDVENESYANGFLSSDKDNSYGDCNVSITPNSVGSSIRAEGRGSDSESLVTGGDSEANARNGMDNSVRPETTSMTDHAVKIEDGKSNDLWVESGVNAVATSDHVVDGDINAGIMPEGMPVPLNFEEFGSAKDMEVLGLERLKVELQARGLKCGGTLKERAARLFMLKTIPIEKLPKKLLAKPLLSK